MAGKETTLCCHLAKTESGMGRSTVITLDAPPGKNFRQIDHRSIEWIIHKNVKYSVKK